MASVRQLLEIIAQNRPAPADSFEERYFKALRAQIQWMAALGETKRSFFWKFAAVALYSPVALWLGYLSPLGEQLGELTGLAYAVALGLYIPGIVIPPGVVLVTLVALASGMFYDEFWRCVEAAKSQQTDKSG